MLRDQPGEMGQLTCWSAPEARAQLLWFTALNQTQMWLLAALFRRFSGALFHGLHGTFLLPLELVICLPAAQGSHVQDPAFQSAVTIDPALIPPLAGPASPVP